MEKFQPLNTNELIVQVAKSALYSVQLLLESLNNVRLNSELSTELYDRLITRCRKHHAEFYIQMGISKTLLIQAWS